MTLTNMTDPAFVHETLLSIAHARAEMDYELGRFLLAAHRLELHESLGYGSFFEYADRIFGMSRREAQERVRTARELESLPRLARALREEALCWSVVRELSRIATDENEEAWIEAARGRSARAVERMVAHHQKGDAPSARLRVEGPKKITLELDAPTWALFRELQQSVTAELGAHVDDNRLVQTIARAMLGRASERDEGRASYPIALTLCERCRTATQRAGADEVVVDEATLERARCDAQELGRVDLVPPPRATQTIPPKVRRAVMRRHGGRCAAPDCRHAAFVELHHTERRADGGDHDPDRLIPLCGSHHSAVHEGKLVIRGCYTEGFVFEHADGTPYGAREASPTRALAMAQTLELLVSMGFKQREAQSMLDRARAHVGASPSVDQLMRAALAQAPLPSGVREEAATYIRAPARAASNCRLYAVG